MKIIPITRHIPFKVRDAINQLENNNILHFKNFITDYDLLKELNNRLKNTIDDYYCMDEQAIDYIKHKTWKQSIRNNVQQSRIEQIVPHEQTNMNMLTLSLWGSNEVGLCDSGAVWPFSNFKGTVKLFREMWNMYATLSGSPLERVDEHRCHIIRYPDTGHFRPHKHHYNPQKYGLILLLSQRGKDYIDGGTKWYYKNESVDTRSVENMGDMFVFKYDLVHEVLNTKVNGNDLGRLTMIIPHGSN